MSHPLVLALFDDVERVAAAARVLKHLGMEGGRMSVVAATHDQEGALAHGDRRQSGCGDRRLARGGP